jgi:hypothetical protein
MDIEILTAKVADQAEIILSLESSLLIRQQQADHAKLEIGQLKERLREIGSGEIMAQMARLEEALRISQARIGGARMDAARVEAGGLTPAAPAAPAEPNAELEAMTRMFMDACSSLGLITEALGLDPNEGGHEPILDAIEELKTAAPSLPAPSKADMGILQDGNRAPAQVGSIGDDPEFIKMLCDYGIWRKDDVEFFVTCIVQRPHQAAPVVLTAGLRLELTGGLPTFRTAVVGAEDAEAFLICSDGVRAPITTAIESALTAQSGKEQPGGGV